jgi:HD-GYP domain-containing protein (c-di-GMP phosphodiesterase class II)
MGKQSIVRFFLIFTGATLCVIAAACAMLTMLRVQSLRGQSEHAAGAVSTGALAPALSRDAGSLSERDLSSFADTATGLLGGDIVAIRLWGPDGTLLAQAGDGAAPENRSTLANAIISGLGTSKESAAGGEVLASYAPLVPRAFLEVQQRYEPIATRISDSTKELVIQLVVGGLLVALLLPIVLWVTINGLMNEYGRLLFLHRTGQSIRETLDLIDMLANFSRDVVTYTGAQIALTALVEDNSGDIIVKASYDGLTKTASHHYRKVEEWYLRRCIGTGEVIQSKEDGLPYETLLGFDPTLRGKVNVLCVPIPGRERVAGLVMAVRFAAQGRFKPAQLQMVQEMAALAAMAVEQATLFSKVRSYAEEVEVGYDSTLKVLTAALDTKDTITQGHSERVARLTVILAREVGVPNEQLVDIERGALLHDVGKIGVPDSILHKPASLNDEEWEKMQKHPLMAGLMVSKVGFLENAIPILLYHHERFDGAGYPFGLEGKAIPLEARIFTVVDAYDAMTSDRPYRLAMDNEDAMAEIIRNSGTQFDPEIVEAFIRVIERIRPTEEEAA